MAQRGRRGHDTRGAVRCPCGRHTALWVHGSRLGHGVSGLQVRRCGSRPCRAGSGRCSCGGRCRGPGRGRCSARNGRCGSPYIRGRCLSRRRSLFSRRCTVWVGSNRARGRGLACGQTCGDQQQPHRVHNQLHVTSKWKAVGFAWTKPVNGLNVDKTQLQIHTVPLVCPVPIRVVPGRKQPSWKRRRAPQTDG